MITYDDKKLDEIIERAAERGAGIYYEQTKHDIDLILESTGFIKERLQEMVTREEFNELRGDVKVRKPGWFPGKK